VGIADEKYVLCTTFRRSGEPVATPVWIAALDERRVGFTTEGTSGKAKRLRNDAAMTLQACDSRGRILAGSTAMSVTAEVVSGDDAVWVAAAIKQKYGIQVTMIQVFYALRNLFTRRPPTETVGIVITLPD
jgi:PPOX class probable F420-dependent enzyme